MSPVVKVVPVPSFVAALSRSSNPDAQASSLLLNQNTEYPIALSLGRRCTFVTTSMGRAFSFGISDEGMLGLGEGITESLRPQEIALPQDGETFASVSAGASHAVALSNSGSIFNWGTLPQNSSHGTNGNKIAQGGSPGAGSRTVDSSTTAVASDICWTPAKVQTPVQHRSRRTSYWEKVVSACAGYDSSAFMVESGHVLTCGKSSGRLGQGETVMATDVVVPRPMFGGLRLWYQRDSSSTPNKEMQQRSIQAENHRNVVDNRKPPPCLPGRPLIRGSTFG